MPRSHPLFPFLSVTLGIAAFSVMDALMKRASIEVGVYNAMLFRSLFAALLVLPVWLLGGGRWPERAALRLHATRSAVAAAMAGLFFWGLVRTPMAEGIALSFIAPLITLYLAAVLLKEKIAGSAITASVLGLAGVLVIGWSRLSSDGNFDADRAWGIAAILLSAVLYAWNLILQRQQAQVANPREIALFQTGGVGLIFALASPWLAVWPQPQVLGTIAWASGLTVIALMLLSWGYARAEAQALVSIEYTGFIWAALMGWLWFAEGVTLATLAGTTLIVIGCGIAARKPYGPATH